MKLIAPEGPLKADFEKLGVEHMGFPRFSNNPIPALRGISDGAHRALNWGVDIFHVHAGVEVLYGVHRVLKRTHPKNPLNQSLRPGVVFTVHSYFGKRPEIDYSIAAHLSRRWADRVIAVSHADGKTLLRSSSKLEGKLHVIHNGMPDHEPVSEQFALDLRSSFLKQYAGGADVPVCIVVGRLASQKGIDILLDALAQYNGTPMLILIAGDGELREELQAQAQRLGLVGSTQSDKFDRPRVIFLGSRNDVSHLLFAADLFVLPSRMEGLSLALVEAHAAGLPCLVTDVGGNAEIVAHERTGIVIPPEDPRALADGLKKLLTDPQILRNMGQTARARYENQFTVNKMVDETTDIYKSTLTENRLLAKNRSQ